MYKYIITFLITLLFNNAVVAKTPDGQTPANEGICDVLIGGTPGLYGLCVAYCEAHDAEQIDATGENLNVPDEKILKNYRKKMNNGDPDMPCVDIPSDCPCWSSKVLDEWLINFAYFMPYTLQSVYFGGQTTSTLTFSSFTNSPGPYIIEIRNLMGSTLSNSTCRAIDYHQPLGQNKILVDKLNLTSQEAISCGRILKRWVEAKGVFCFDDIDSGCALYE